MEPTLVIESPKLVSEALDYVVDFSLRLNGGTTITAVSVRPPDEMTITNVGRNETNTACYFRAAGGTLGRNLVGVSVTCSDSRVLSEVIAIMVEAG